MTQCTCGAECIKVNGKLWALHDRADHFARVNRKRPRARKPKAVSPDSVALVKEALGWPQKDAAAFVREHGKLSDDALLKVALAAQAESMKARGKLG